MLAHAKKHRLSGLERDYLRAIPGGTDRLVALWRLLLPGEFDTAERVEPTEHAIPKADWVALASVDFADGAGAWLNVGPSSY